MKLGAYIDQFFSVSRRGSTIQRELGAGLTTFLTMCYILAVNPIVLSAAGMEKEAVFFATAVSAGITTLLMGLFVNVPVALAPGMGLNAYFVSVVLSSDGAISYNAALGAVFLSGLIFLVLTLTRIRPLLVTAFPEGLKVGIGAGIGLFLIFIGFKSAGILGVVSTTDASAGVLLAGWEVQAGSLASPSVAFCLLGLALVGIGAVKKWNFAIILTIALLTSGSVLLGETDLPSASAML
jgi:AGZA family xanthine/uracil permease-like MFS transporter